MAAVSSGVRALPVGHWRTGPLWTAPTGPGSAAGTSEQSSPLVPPEISRGSCLPQLLSIEINIKLLIVS